MFPIHQPCRGSQRSVQMGNWHLILLHTLMMYGLEAQESSSANKPLNILAQLLVPWEFKMLLANAA
eukprot:2002719-Ditylum_brightwellii.AAC.1